MDGALATELEARGADLNHPLWSAKILAENPASILEFHMDYLRAGADIITTATYQASFQGLSAHGYNHTAAENIFRQGIGLALSARSQVLNEGNRSTIPLVAASIGPYGAYLADGSEFSGHYEKSNDFLKEFHKERLELLASTEVDLLAIETIPCIQEAQVLAELVEAGKGKKAWLSFSCRNAEELSSGEKFEEALKIVNRFQNIVAVGVNCTAPQHVEALLKIGSQTTDKMMFAYPNKGGQYDAVSKCWLDSGTSVSDFKTYAIDWFNAGASMIGGCCRTSPAEIRALADAVF